MKYLEAFSEALEKKWKGSLVSVAEARPREKNAKKYLSLLAQQGKVTRVSWGWYYLPVKQGDFYEFLAGDKHLKVLHKQTAASYWNGDFIHRDQYTIAVEDPSYGEALEKAAESQGWKVRAETRDLEGLAYKRIGSLYVESLENTIIDCLKEWAFTDAFATLHTNEKRINWETMSARYWERIPGTNMRIGQILKYGANLISPETHSSRATIPDDFMKRQVEEAAGKVAELA